MLKAAHEYGGGYEKRIVFTMCGVLILLASPMTQLYAEYDDRSSGVILYNPGQVDVKVQTS